MTPTMTAFIRGLLATAAGAPQPGIAPSDVEALRRRMDSVSRGFPPRLVLTDDETTELEQWRHMPGVTAEWTARDLMVLRVAATAVAAEAVLTAEQRSLLYRGDHAPRPSRLTAA
jgi:hypothetical protein